MAKWLEKIMAAGVNETLAQVSTLAEKHTGKKERDLAIAQMLMQNAEATISLIKDELDVRSKVMIAELTQDDKWTKRARPMIIYAGLVAMFIDAWDKIQFTMPDMFWDGWMLAVGIYALGRSAEKLGANGQLGKVAEWVTGNKKKRRSLLEE